MPAPAKPPISACELDGNADPPRDEVPDDRAHQRAEDDVPVDDAGRDDAGADRLRHVQAEEQERDEVEERRPDDRHAGREHARRDHGRDRIRRVVQAVHEIEHQRNGDQRRR